MSRAPGAKVPRAWFTSPTSVSRDGEPGGSEPPDADRASLVVAEPALDLEAQPVGQYDVVAHLGVEIEGDVGRVQGHVVLQQGGDPAVAPAGDRDVAVPEQTVMDHEQRPRRHALDRRLGGVHRGHDPLIDPFVLHLEPVHRVPLVGDLADPQKLVGVGDDVGERGGGRHLASACMDAGRGAAIRVPAAIESAAAWTRDRRVWWTRVSRAGFGT